MVLTKLSADGVNTAGGAET